MKTNEKKDLWTKSADELKKLINDAQAALVTLRLDKAQNKLKNTRELFTKRKEVATFKTILKVKEEKK